MVNNFFSYPDQLDDNVDKVITKYLGKARDYYLENAREDTSAQKKSMYIVDPNGESDYSERSAAAQEAAAARGKKIVIADEIKPESPHQGIVATSAADYPIVNEIGSRDGKRTADLVLTTAIKDLENPFNVDMTIAINR